jgi:hypothetical protein
MEQKKANPYLSNVSNEKIKEYYRRYNLFDYFKKNKKTDIYSRLIQKMSSRSGK